MWQPGLSLVPEVLVKHTTIFSSSDSPSGVQSYLDEMNSQVTQVNSLLASADPSSTIHTSLTTVKSVMEQLSTALSGYSELLQTRRNRFKRATGEGKIVSGFY